MTNTINNKSLHTSQVFLYVVNMLDCAFEQAQLFVFSGVKMAQVLVLATTLM